MAMPIPLPTYTVDQVRGFPDDGNRYELVAGMLLVTPAPASDHQVVIVRLTSLLQAYVGDPGPAQALIGFRAAVDLEAGLMRTVAAARLGLDPPGSRS